MGHVQSSHCRSARKLFDVAHPRPLGYLAFFVYTFAASGANGITMNVDSRQDAVDQVPGDGRCATASGPCTLRAAVQEANALRDNSTIRLPAGLYRLNSVESGKVDNSDAVGDLDITASMTIQGAGSSVTIIDGGLCPSGSLGACEPSVIIPFDRRVIDILPPRPARFPFATVSFQDITIQNGGGGPGAFYGGGIRNTGAVVNLRNVIVKHNTVLGWGAGIANFGSLHVTRSTITENRTNLTGQGSIGATGVGGGILNVRGFPQGGATISQSTISNNKATLGAGIANAASVATLRSTNPAEVFIANSTISGNKAELRGGGVLNAAGNVYITFSTIVDNWAFRSSTSRPSKGVGGGLSNEVNTLVEKPVPSRVFLESSILADNRIASDRNNFPVTETEDCHSPPAKDPIGKPLLTLTSYRGNVIGILPTNLSKELESQCDIKDYETGDKPKSGFDKWGTSPLPQLRLNLGLLPPTFELAQDSLARDAAFDCTTFSAFHEYERQNFNIYNDAEVDQHGFPRPVANCDSGAYEFGARAGDLDSNGNVDVGDLDLLMASLGQVNDLRGHRRGDIDGDGSLTAMDARRLIMLCARPRCAK